MTGPSSFPRRRGPGPTVEGEHRRRQLSEQRGGWRKGREGEGNGDGDGDGEERKRGSVKLNEAVQVVVEGRARGLKLQL